MRSLLQARLVDFLSARGWHRLAGLQRLVGRRISSIEETAETYPGPGKLFKLGVENGADDEVTIGIVARP